MKINLDNYKSTWRPTIGWIFVISLSFQYIVNPLLLWCNALFNWGVTPPNMNIDEHMWELIIGMIGLGTLRSFDKKKEKETTDGQ